MSINNMYDELATLFGLEDDKRMRLFLHGFMETVNREPSRLFKYSNCWDTKPRGLLDAVSGDAPDAMSSIYFRGGSAGVFDPSPTGTSGDGTELVSASDYKSTHRGGDDVVDPEVVIFVDTLLKQLANLVARDNETEKKRRLDIINKYSKAIGIKGVAQMFNIKHDGKRYVYDETKNSINESNLSLSNKLGFNDLNELNSAIAKINAWLVVHPQKDYRKYKMFTYKIDKFTAQAMLEEAKNAPTPVGKSTFLASLDDGTTDEYFRDAKDPSKLFTRKPDGTLVEVSKGSKAFVEATKDNCVGLHVDKAQCTEYLLDCINGSDPTQCRKYMADTKFWGNDATSIKTEVKSMLPAMALLTLEKFGFKQVVVNDSVAKRQLNKVESVNSWLVRLEKDMASDATAFESIQKNTNLTLYLNLLVEKINGSPQILNKDIVQSEETQTYNPAKFQGQLLSQYGLRPKLPVVNYVGMMNRISDMVRYAVKGSFMVPSFVVVQNGGAMDDYKSTAIELENTFNLLKNVLKAHNKDLDSSNESEIRELLKSLKNTENKVVQTIKIMDKYIELMDVYKHNDPHKVLNLETLDEITRSKDHQLEKFGKKQDTIAQALVTIADALQQVVNKSTPQTVTQTPFPRDV